MFLKLLRRTLCLLIYLLCFTIHLYLPVILLIPLRETYGSSWLSSECDKEIVPTLWKRTAKEESRQLVTPYFLLDPKYAWGIFFGWAAITGAVVKVLSIPILPILPILIIIFLIVKGFVFLILYLIPPILLGIQALMTITQMIFEQPKFFVGFVPPKKSILEDLK